MPAISVTDRSAIQRLALGLPRPYWVLWLGLLINRTGSFIVPLMTVYLTKERRLSLVDAGAVISLYGVGSLVGTTLGGWLADHVGRRTTLLVSLASSSSTMLVLSQAQEVTHIAPLVFALGLTADLFRPASQALVADLVPPEHRVKAFGAQYWAINLGFALGTATGGFVAAKSGFGILFFADAATTMLCGVLVFLGIPETRPVLEPEKNQGSMLTPFTDSKFAPFLVLSYLMAFIFMQHLTVLPKNMADRGLQSDAFGVALATNGILIIALQPFVLKRVTSLAVAIPLAVGATLTGVGFGFTAFAQTLPTFALSVAIWTLGEIVMAPVNSTVVANRAPAHLRGRYQGAFGLTWSLAFVTAPIVGPRLAETVTTATFWALCFGASLVAAVGYLIALPANPKG